MEQKEYKSIYDRNGNRIRVYAGNDKEEKEIYKDVYEYLEKKLGKEGLKKNLFYFLIKYPKIIYSIFSKEPKREKIRKIIIKEVMQMKKEPEYIKIKINDLVFKAKTFSLFLLIDEIMICNQYDINYNNIMNKIVIDAGANIGIFSIYAAKLGAKKVYAFEPVKETYEILKEMIKENKLENIIIPVNKALGDKNKIMKIKYSGAGDGGASLNRKKRNKGKEREIEVITLDDFVKENKIERVDFIKMDVEGYEENVLLGAKEIIKKYKPVLSFSAYHLPTDKERLPKVVLSIRPDYKIKLNNYWEEDFYCE